jgi:hypothetical protein
MIASLTGLFLDRDIPAAAPAGLTGSVRLLVVDACAERRRVRELFARLERRAPVSVALARLECLERVPNTARFDRVWVMLDAGSDRAYCAVVEAELAVRFSGARLELVAVGPVDALERDFALTQEQVGGAPPWRRGRELASGAAAAAGFLGHGSGVSR